MIKTLLLTAALLAAGVAVGVGHSAFDLGYFVSQSALDGDAEIDLLPENSPQPHVEVEAEQHDFGRMEKGQKGEHRYVFRNTGKGPLLLRAGDPPCKCTTPIVEKSLLQPGESTEVVVGWTTDQSPGPFRKTIPIHTSDRRRLLVQLELQGNIVQSYEAQSEFFEFGRMYFQQSRTALVRLFGFGAAPLEVKRWEFTDPAAKDYFEVEFEPLAKEATGREDATSGLLVRLKAKPGLPQGPIRQGLRVWLNVVEDPIELVARGEVTSDISIEGPNWDDSTQRLNLGLVSGKEGARRRLEVRLAGGHHDASKFRIARVDPPEMQVTLGAPEKLGGTKNLVMPLEISIPPGVRPLNRMGSSQGPLAEIVLDTDRPDGKPLTIYVRFATQGE
jgi:hypothetical protein